MIKITDLQVRRGVQVLLDNSQATINPNQKVGLVGKNGCGKSTLLSLIKGELQPEQGSLHFPSNWSLAWVLQDTPALDISAIEYVLDGDREYRSLSAALEKATEQNDGNEIARIHELLDVIGAWTIHSRASQLLAGLGFSEHQLNSPVKDFSGGWRMRLNLAQALICRSDLLLLDEPTNHLDLDAVIWLEKWLQSYPGTLILISHDRDFMDPICDKILHIERQQIFEYTGNYSDFERQRATKLAQHQAAVEAQAEKRTHLQSYIDRFRAKASKAKQAQSRIKMLERMDELIPLKIDRGFEFQFPKPISLPNPILQMEKVSAGYKDVTILQSIKLNLVPGSRIGLLGRNGAGKSTLVKLLAGDLSPTAGEIALAKGVALGYFAQHQLEYLDPQGSPLLHFQRIAPKTTDQVLRNYLGGFAFHGDKVLEPTENFSGGEKARLVLALIIWQKPNMLLLDEPTNHLDLEMRDALTDALIAYEGALVVVSHDRHLLRAVTDEFYLVDDGKVEPFDGDLEDYQRWLNEQQKKINQTKKTQSDTKPLTNKTSTVDSASKKEQKKNEAEKRAQSLPLRKKIAELEKSVALYEKKLAEIELALSDNELYAPERKEILQQYLNEQTDIRKKLETAEADWLELLEVLESD
ncbi:ABC transporter ATP-binding protein [Thorsellia anophelis]|uniref:Probable ATP-binding protein YheS n=1 Tax=Thorsellia anophelis DSM 18579 TaxID=1123402 RepID=A0A1I0E4W5_9GAMM|nr:ABC transporter ATP-binding protein [Thorsellia anophelis]SET40044.1 ATP-binding cassette, subfamily F, member 3 [Thorsellia anophelis DSM 18579]